MLKFVNSDETHKSVIELPSKARCKDIYQGKLDDGVVEITCMTTRDEQLLATSNGYGSDKVSIIIDRCTKLPQGMTSKDLLITDRFYIMVALRCLSIGSTYEADNIKCPSCGFNHKETVDLTKDLEFLEYDEDNPDDVNKTLPYIVELPISKAKVEYKLLVGHDEIAIEKYREKELKRKNNQEIQTDPAYIYQFAKRIVSINDKAVNILDAIDFISTLLLKDLQVFKKAMKSDETGVNMMKEFSCRSCGEVYKSSSKLDANFFCMDTE